MCFLCYIAILAIFGRHYPAMLRDLVAWYVRTYHDELMGRPPAWFQSFVWCELLLQLPLFFFATYALWHRRNWIRVPLMIYGAHVATTVLPIAAHFVFDTDIAMVDKIPLLSFYLPYFAIPLILTVHMAFTEQLFEDERVCPDRKTK